jgi:LPS sulfotransferase NodH
LAELLANTGKLPRAGEWFNWPHVISFSERMGAKSFPHFCQLLAKNTSKQGHFVGKIGLSQLYLLSRMRAIPDVFASPHMIFVRRRDVLAQAISYVIAEQTGEWKHHAARKRQVATSRTPTYDGAAIARNIRGITGTNAGFEEFFANFDFPVMEVVYEDLVAEESDKISAITEWLGLGPTAIEREAVTLKRQRNSVNDEWRERFLSERMTYFARATDEQIAKLVRLS